MKIESAVTKLLISKPYPDRDKVFVVYSRYNTPDLFKRARQTVIDAGVNFKISYSDKYVMSNRLKIFFINDIELEIHGVHLDGFWYDEDEFVNSRPFRYRVTPRLVWRYGTVVKVE